MSSIWSCCIKVCLVLCLTEAFVESSTGESTRNHAELRETPMWTPASNAWDQGQCKLLNKVTSISLEKCKMECQDKKGCNSINYSPKKKGFCMFLECPMPLPPPKATSKYFKGYHLLQLTKDDCKNECGGIIGLVAGKCLVTETQFDSLAKCMKESPMWEGSSWLEACKTCL